MDEPTTNPTPMPEGGDMPAGDNQGAMGAPMMADGEQTDGAGTPQTPETPTA